MTRQDFLKALDEVLELPSGTLQGCEQLSELGCWDSMAMIGYIALADEHTGAKLTPRQIVACKTISDLLTLAKVEP